jgi:hypothetical protein
LVRKGSTNPWSTCILWFDPGWIPAVSSVSIQDHSMRFCWFNFQNLSSITK